MESFETYNKPKKGKECPNCKKIVGCRSNTCKYCKCLISKKVIPKKVVRLLKYTGKNEALSEDTKLGERKELGIYNKMKDDGIKPYRLSPSGKGATNKRKDELEVLYRNLFYCEVKRCGCGKFGGGFKISRRMPRALWYLICDLHREYSNGERIPNTQEELDAMQNVIENDKSPPEEWIRVSIVGIDIYGESDSFLIIIESKTDRPNAGIQHDMKRNLLTYQALLLLKNHREKRSRKIVVAVAKKTNDLPRGWFAEDQKVSFDNVNQLWTPLLTQSCVTSGVVESCQDRFKQLELKFEN